MINGVDYSTSRPEPHSLYMAGFRYASRYVGLGGRSKRLSPIEAQALTRAGLAIIANCEGAAEGWMLGGYAIGRAAAAASLLDAGLCGMPDGRPVYYSCDFDVTEAQWPDVRACLRGASSVHGLDRTGIYGGTNALRWARRDGVATWFWQALGWRHGDWEPYAHVRQWRNGVTIAGGDVDLDEATVTDFGQWYSTLTPGGPMLDLADLVSALADGSTRDGYVWETEPVSGPHIKGRTLADILNAVRAISAAGGGLTDADRKRIEELTAAVTELNSRLATP